MPSGTPNPSKLRPLTAHAWAALESLARGPIPRQCINPGVNERLEREGLTVVELMASPYGRPDGPRIQHAVITDKGRAKLADRDA